MYFSHLFLIVFIGIKLLLEKKKLYVVSVTLKPKMCVVTHVYTFLLPTIVCDDMYV